MEVGTAYDFQFDILEKNAIGGGVGFRLPFTSPAVLDLGLDAQLQLARQGTREFKAEDTWSGLLQDGAKNCVKLMPRGAAALYPMTGSIGLGQSVRTFVEIYEQGGAKESFVDKLLFTTDVSGTTKFGSPLFQVGSLRVSLPATR